MHGTSAAAHSGNISAAASAQNDRTCWRRSPSPMSGSFGSRCSSMVRSPTASLSPATQCWRFALATPGHIRSRRWLSRSMFVLAPVGISGASAVAALAVVVLWSRFPTIGSGKRPRRTGSVSERAGRDSVCSSESRFVRDLHGQPTHWAGRLSVSRASRAALR